MTVLHVYAPRARRLQRCFKFAPQSRRARAYCRPPRGRRLRQRCDLAAGHGATATVPSLGYPLGAGVVSRCFRRLALSVPRYPPRRSQRIYVVLVVVVWVVPRQCGSGSGTDDLLLGSGGSSTSSQTHRDSVGSGSRPSDGRPFPGWHVGDRYTLLYIIGQGSYGEVGASCWRVSVARHKEVLCVGGGAMHTDPPRALQPLPCVPPAVDATPGRGSEGQHHGYTGEWFVVCV